MLAGLLLILCRFVFWYAATLEVSTFWKNRKWVVSAYSKAQFKETEDNPISLDPETPGLVFRIQFSNHVIKYDQILTKNSN